MDALEDALADDMAEIDREAPHGIRLDLMVTLEECEEGEEPQPLSDWELWACAAETLKEHGEQAPAFVAARLGQLALNLDARGVQAWTAIAARIEKLRAAKTVQ